MIPEGDYGLGTWVNLNKGTGVSINLEGTIYRTGTDEGNMISIKDSTDVEFYSATSKGAIQGYGYEFHKDGSYGPRIRMPPSPALTMWTSPSFSDAPPQTAAKMGAYREGT